MKVFLKTVSLTAFCAVLGFPVCAETLLDALAYTYETNPILQAQRAYLRSVDEKVGQAKAGYRPYVGIEADATHADQKFKGYPQMGDFDYDNDTYDAGVVLKQSVFSGFKTVSSVDYAETNVLKERENNRSVEQNVLLSAAIAYVDVIRDRAVLELQKNQEQVLKRHLSSYEKRYKVGDLTKTDVAQSEARLEGAKANRITAQGNLDASVAGYVSLIGKQPDKKIEIDDYANLLPKTLEDALARVNEANPELKASEYAQKASEHNVSLQKGSLMPEVTINAGAGYQWGQPLPVLDDNYDGQYWQVGAKLSVPLYQGGAEYAKIREAKQLSNQARISLEQVRRDLIKRTTQAWEQYQSAKSAITSIKAQIKASKMALDGTIREADVGSRTVLDVLDAEQEYLNYRVALVTAERNMTASALNLLALTGNMTADSLKLKVTLYEPKDHYDEVKNKWIGTGVD